MEQDPPYIVMPLADGGSLEQSVREQPPDLKTVEDWLWQLLWFCQPTAAALVVSEPFSFGLGDLKDPATDAQTETLNALQKDSSGSFEVMG